MFAAGAGDGDHADIALCQVVRGQSLTGVMDKDEGQIIDCLERMS
jgi:hypothetical protein